MARRRWLACAAPLILLGCDAEPLAPPAKSVSAAQLAAAVTTALADSIDDDGRFILADRRRQDGSELTEQRAKELVWAYWRGVEGELRVRAQKDRGGFPLAARLQVCSRAFYAESGYETLPPELPEGIRRLLGPVWLVGLCNGNVQELSISISSEATDLSVRADGTISILKTGDFWDDGVPLGTTIPAWPERAAVAAAAPGYRISGVPVLRRRARFSAMIFADWYFPIEHSGEVRGLESGVRRTVDELQFGPYSSFNDYRVLDANPDYAERSRVESINFQGSLIPLMRRAEVAYWREPVVRVAP